jgi:hypothetical protein
MREAKPLPDLEYLREILSYDKETGLFYWKLPRQNIRVGSIAGTRNNRGYIQIRIDQECYRAHRLAWYFLTNIDPVDKQVDHINGIAYDNRASNLRLATDSQNKANQSMRKKNKSGYKGVSFNKSVKKWHAQICIDYKRIHIGYFDSPELAHAAYCKRAVELFGEFARAA